MAQDDQGQPNKAPIDERIRDRAKDLIRDILEALDGLLAPPAVQPVPVRVRRPGRR